ncbi:valyl-tRNA synthetase [Escherichia coli O157:H7 str. K6687]|nr:valyl-tRNA synthetase [Escherichia coli O157:H7 str. K6687]
MINRIKLEHILEYARQQRHIGQHCKIPPGDMVEIMEIAMRKAGNSPVTPDGWISCSERMPNDKQYVWCLGSLTAGLSAIPSKGITIVRETNGGQLLTMGKNRHRK